MHHYSIVFCKTRGSRTLLINKLAKGISHLVPYEPGQSHILSLSDNVLFISTQNHDFLRLGKRHLIAENDFVAYDGFCRTGSRNLFMASVLMNAFRDYGAFGLNDYLAGEFCAGHYCSTKQSISGVSDFTGLRPLYYLNNSVYFAISNRQMFLNPLLTESGMIIVDFNEVADLIGKGNKFSDRSILKDVMLLRPGFGISYSPDSGLNVRRSGQPIFIDRGLPSKDDYINSVQEIVNNFDELNNFPGLDESPIRISLTGGEDSRLVLAAALNSSVANRIETFTYGYPDNPDIAAAEMVAKKAGVPHIKNIQTPPKNVAERSINDIWTDLRRHAFRYEGAPGAWDGGAGCATQTRLDLSGLYSEFFKRVRESNASVDITSPEVALKLLRDFQQPFDPLGILKYFSTQRSVEADQKWLDYLLSEGAELNDIPELYYHDFRISWWTGSMASNVGSLVRIAPLASRLPARTALKQTISDRGERRFIFEAMLALRPDLLELPYLKKKWPEHFQSIANHVKLPGIELHLPYPQHPSVPWQNTLAKRGGVFIMDYIKSHSFDDLSEVIDIPQLTRFLTDPALVNNTPIVRSICNLCEILILASGDQSRFPHKIANNFLEGPSRVTNITELASWASGSSPIEKLEPSLERSAISTKQIEFDVNFPAESVTNVRIDPSVRPCTLTLSKIILKKNDGAIFPVPLNVMRHNDQLVISKNQDNSLQLVVSGNDPHLYFPVGFDFNSIVACMLTLKVQPGYGPLELFFDFGQGFSRAGMVSLPY
jgi:hypothetical protein